MRCPSCHQALRPGDRLGVHLACCPACQGVWVSHGELTRLLGRARWDRWGPEPPVARPAGPTWPQEIEFYDFG